MEKKSDKTNDKYSVLLIDLILSLSSITMQLMGKVSDPESGKFEIDLKKARINIDMLAMLKDKTTGNLSKQEDDLLNTTLSNLQVNYLEIVENNQNKEN